MTKIARIIAVDFGKYLLGYTRKKKTTVINEGTELIDVATIISSNPVFSGVFVGKIQPKYPASSTIYFRENYVLQNESGEFVTTNQGFGVAGTTDGEGKLTPNYALPALSLTAPSAGTKYKLSESFNVTWTSSNITLVNVILESESGGYKKYSDVDATLGTLAVAISASDGFSINETVYIYIENTHQTVEDSVRVQSIATLTIDAPTLTAGVEGNVTGTHNGGTGYLVQVQYRVASPEGAWTTFENNVTVEADGTWEATGTVALAETYDFRARDTVDPDGQIQLDDIVVASGIIDVDIETADLLLTMANMVSIGSNEVIITANVTKNGANPTINGQAVSFTDSGTNYLSVLSVCFKYNFTTDTIGWLKVFYPQAGQPNYRRYVASPDSKGLVYDGSTYAYFITFEHDSTTYLKFPRFHKIAVSDGTVTELQTSGGTWGSISTNLCGLHLYDGKLYSCTFASTITSQMGVIQVSDMTQLHIASVGSGYADPNFVQVGTTPYIFLSEYPPDRLFASRVNANYSLTTMNTFNDAEILVGYGLEYDGKIIVSYKKNTSGTFHLHDGTSETAVAFGGRLMKTNGLTFCIQRSSDNIARVNTSTLEFAWNVDYSATWDQICTVEYDGSRYLVAGRKAGTQHIKIAEINPDDGSL